MGNNYPTLENCNQDDPKEMFQWMMVALPFAGATPFIIQPEIRPQWSELFYDLGLRHHPELMTKKVVPPRRGENKSFNGSVLIVDADEPDPEPTFIQDPATMTNFEQEIQLERYRHLDRLPRIEPEVEGAEVVAPEDLFNPSDHTVSGVNGYLMAPIPMAEKRRVIAAEMAGKCRDGIIRKNRGI